MARPYYWKIQSERCSYCRGLEHQAEYEKGKVQTIDKFLTNTKMPLTKEYRDNLANEEFNTATHLETVKRKLGDCRFPYCDGKCGNNE
jgi:hypothetical protein